MCFNIIFRGVYIYFYGYIAFSVVPDIFIFLFFVSVSRGEEKEK